MSRHLEFFQVGEGALEQCWYVLGIRVFHYYYLSIIMMMMMMRTKLYKTCFEDDTTVCSKDLHQLTSFLPGIEVCRFGIVKALRTTRRYVPKICVSLQAFCLEYRCVVLGL